MRLYHYPRQPDEPLGDEDALFPVAVGELVVDGVEGLLFPAAVYLDVAHLLAVEVHLAEVVEQAADRQRLGAPAAAALSGQLNQPLVDIPAVFHQSALTGQVVAGTGRGGEEVGFFHPLKQSVGALPGDGLAVTGDEFLFGHRGASFIRSDSHYSRPRGKMQPGSLPKWPLRPLPPKKPCTTTQTVLY